MTSKRTKRPDDVVSWLAAEPSLDDLVTAYTQDWIIVERNIARVIARDDPKALKAYICDVARPEPPLPGRSRPKRDLLAAEIRRQMTLHALNGAIKAASAGTTGPIRFNIVNGYLMQKLFFRHELVRKPASMPWFRLLWPMLTQRRLLLPLVQPRGIYCFYSRLLVRRLAGLIGARPAVEIAAGDGTLSRFLREEGADVTATDNRSWHQVEVADDVVEMEAAQALRQLRAPVVLCSWPPPGNDFERRVFCTAEVDTYIVLTSRDEDAAGDWDAYRRQTAFDMTLTRRSADCCCRRNRIRSC